MTTYRGPICLFCLRYRGMRDLDTPDQTAVGVCDAYPEGIPTAIWHSQVDHRQPYQGDNGLQFLPESPTGTRYAALVFDDEAATKTE